MRLKMFFLGIKGKLQDYVVLFSGLVLTISIFYMFQCIANNYNLLEKQIFQVVFQFGSVFLGIVTFFYLQFCNSFLMSLKRKEYSLFMLLGANKKKIRQLIFLETLLTGIVALLIGIFVGFGLTAGVNYSMVKTLYLEIGNVKNFSFPALTITILFFVCSFILIAKRNANAMGKHAIIDLMRAEHKPFSDKKKTWVMLLESLLGIFLLIVSYSVMGKLALFQLPGILLILITVVLGSYFSIHALTVLLIRALKVCPKFHLRKLNIFLLAQLEFRIRDYTKILAILAILFGLAMGAITVGFEFKSLAKQFSEQSQSYDLILNNPVATDQEAINKLNPQKNTIYRYKEDEKKVYMAREQFNRVPLEVKKWTLNGKIQTHYLNAQALKKKENAIYLQDLFLPSQQKKQLVLLSEASFTLLKSKPQTIQLIITDNFYDKLETVGDLVTLNKQRNPELSHPSANNRSNQKYEIYHSTTRMVSSFSYMGFFLGLAFLAMLASCLMFKILTGTFIDKKRYQILFKLGTPKKVLSTLIYKEILVLFLIPAGLGILHVWFGLEMFKLFLPNPYQRIMIPILIFCMGYAFYYFVTCSIYRKLVLQKELSK